MINYNKNIKRQRVLSIIGMAYIEPIMTLYKEMSKHNFQKYSRTRVSGRENGYSVSIIILSVLLVESLINRIKYFKKSHDTNNYKYFTKLSTNIVLNNKLLELYIVRDLIVHNHVRSLSYILGPNYEEKKIYHRLIKGYGDKKFDRYIQQRNKPTPLLKLNVNPIMIGKDDVLKIFSALKEILLFLESLEAKQGQRYFDFSIPYEWEGKECTFYEFIDKATKTPTINQF